MNKIMNYKFDGSRVFHMNETIIANWNSVVGPDDIIFHLGDFCLGGSAEWINVLNRLNGKIYLIAGNHDIKDLRQNYTKYFEQITMQMHIEVDKQKIYLHRYLFKVLRIILPEILYIVIAGYKIYFPIQSV